MALRSGGLLGGEGDPQGDERVVQAGARAGGMASVVPRGVDEVGRWRRPARGSLDDGAVASVLADHAVGLELTVGARDGPAGESQIVGQLADGWQPLTG